MSNKNGDAHVESLSSQDYGDESSFSEEIPDKLDANNQKCTFKEPYKR